MRVLLVSHYYHPEPMEKVHDMARRLVALGHEVEVITGFPCYPFGRIYDGYRQRLHVRETIDGVSVVRVPQFPDHSKSVVWRMAYYVSFAASAALIGLFVSRRPDIILGYLSALPEGFSTRFLSACKRTPYVLDVADLWPESVTSSGMITNPLAVSMIRWAVRFVYAGARHISVVTEGFRSSLLALGVPDEKLTVIHNWMPSETYQRTPPDSDLARREGLAGRFNIMYAGNMGAPQHLRTVLETAKLLRNEQRIQFVLVGSGVEHDELVAMVARDGITNVRFLGRRAPETMASLYALADVLLVHLKPDVLTEVTIPSKTFAYMAAGKPVLMAVAGEAARFVEKERFGIAVEPSNPEKLASAVRWIYEQPPEVREAMAQAAIRAHEQKYCGDVQIVRMAQILNAAAQRA